jgi:hypothetical protein
VRMGDGPMLPFDTLIEDVYLHHRYLVARARSNAITTDLPRYLQPTASVSHEQTRKQFPNRLGILS